MTITKPGLVFDMDDETYHGDPVPGGSLSSTFARLLTSHVPVKADALRRNRKPTKAMNLGKAAHATALGAGPQLIVWEHDGRTKGGKAERAAAADVLATEAAVAVTQEERDRIIGMAEVLRRRARGPRHHRRRQDRGLRLLDRGRRLVPLPLRHPRRHPRVGLQDRRGLLSAWLRARDGDLRLPPAGRVLPARPACTRTPGSQDDPCGSSCRRRRSRT